MEHSPIFENEARGAGDDAFELERQLALAERRYVEARERAQRARDECHALEADFDARVEVVKQARLQYDAAQAKCLRLRNLIEELEERLDP